MKTRDEVLLALMALKSDFERCLSKTSPNEIKNTNILKGRISAIKACISDIRRGGEFELKRGYLSTASAVIKMAVNKRKFNTEVNENV